MANGFHHLTRDERCQIYALRKRGVSVRGIARDLGCSPSTISREIRRNSGRRGYRFKQADQLACKRRHLASCLPRKMTAALWHGIEERLAQQQWSPEQIAGRLRLDGIVSVSPSWIYRHVWSDRSGGGTLYRNLRRRGKKANRRGRDGAGRGVIPGRVGIEERPAVVEEKSRIGDWEADTIIGAGHQGALVSLVDRASKYTLLQQVPQKTAAAVSAAIVQCLLPFVMLVHTITADNGKEFAGHQSLAQFLGTLFFFARPYHSWERGLNEHTNGLVRQYFPKSTDLRTIGAQEVRRVQDRLNNRPRKSLGYRTPEEVFRRALDAVEALPGDRNVTMHSGLSDTAGGP